MNNRPLLLIDPTGHAGCLDDGMGEEACSSVATIPPPQIDIELIIDVLAEYAGFDAIAVQFFVPTEINFAGFIASQETTIGIEALYNVETNDITLFLVATAAFTFGKSASAVSFSLVFNIDDDNLAYAGPFSSVSLGYASGVGASLTYSWTTGDNPFSPEDAYSFTFTPTAGGGPNGSFAESVYVPLITFHDDGEMTPHTGGWIANETSLFLQSIYNGIIELSQAIQ